MTMTVDKVLCANGRTYPMVRNRVSPEQVWQLYYVERLSTGLIAAQLDVSRSTVARLLAKARKARPGEHAEGRESGAD